MLIIFCGVPTIGAFVIVGVVVFIGISSGISAMVGLGGAVNVGIGNVVGIGDGVVIIGFSVVGIIDVIGVDDGAVAIGIGVVDTGDNVDDIGDIDAAGGFVTLCIIGFCANDVDIGLYDDLDCVLAAITLLLFCAFDKLILPLLTILDFPFDGVAS